ncbi:hypothetical protein L0F63_000553 [Massospora cicadina]|nr:hypothetical protein L0F63_000553 [Massospora cicadina]
MSDISDFSDNDKDFEPLEEIDPSSSAKEFLNAGEGNMAADFMSDILESLPGVDEAMSLS